VYKRISLLVGVDGVIKCLGFLILPIYLALMSKKEFGEFGYYTSAIGFLVPMVILGLYVPQIKEFSATTDLQRKKTIFSSTFLVVSIFTGLLIAIISVTGLGQFFFGSFFGIEKNAGSKYLAFVVLLYAGTLNLVLYAHAMSLKSGKALALYNGLRFILTNVASLACLYIGLGFADTSLDRVIGTAIAEVCFCCIALYWFGRNYWTWKIDKDYLRGAIKIGLSITPSAVAGLIGSMSTPYFLGIYHGMGQLAEYNLAIQFISPVQMIMVATQTAWAPHVFSIIENREAYNKSFNFMWKVLMVMVGATLGLCMLVLFAKKFNIVPSNYTDVQWLVPLLAISTITSSLVQIPNNLLIRLDKAGRVSIISWSGALLTTAAGFYITRPFGYAGAALSAAVIQIVILSISWRTTKHSGAF